MLGGGPHLWWATGDAPATLERGIGAVLSRAALLAAAQASRTALGADLTWHLVLPHRYVAGLMVLVRSLAVGRPPVLSSPDLADLRPSGDGDAISIVATQLYVWDGAPLPGALVDVRPDDRAPEGAGRIALGGPTLSDGYLDDSGAITPAARDGWLVTADWGTLRDGILQVGGRLDDVVITGGVNVDLGALRRAVEELDPHAAVLGVPDREWGTRIVLFSAGGSLAGWREQLASSLARTALPRQLVLVADLPRTAGGKPDREALLALAAT